MSDIYEPQQIERETQQYWEDQGLFSVTEDLSKEKFYCLAMLPYPSGKLHMGHVRNYTISDVIARYQRMLGKNVLQPMGWDAFGLPAENAAIQNQVAPAKWTYENIKEMRTQFKRLGFAFDWRRELATCRPEFYRWEQWFFTKLFEKGLVYKKSAMINWDPVDETILANEQVIDGRGWRSGALVERREIPQWFLKITHYAEELLNGLDGLPGWPDEVRTMQRNWIGRSEGALVQFEVLDQATSIEVFTTRVDTLFGVNYLAVAPQHPLALQAATNNPALQLFIDECRAIPTAEAVVATLVKRGQDTGVRVRHPLTGDILPVWAANFVLMDYGTGAVMAVPAHDERDFEFAQKYDLPISPVITLSAETEHDYSQAALITTAGTLINSGEFNGLDYDAARLAITAHLIKLNKGCQKLSYRLRDWSVSRQRYWGTPVPIIHCASCGAVAVPEAQLPVLLPENISFSGASSPLKDLPEFYNTNCPKCGGEAQRETDTFDTFMESSWYYARYTCRNQEQAMLDDRAKYWLPVDQYIGGIEHAVMHLLYARFYHKLLRDAGLVNSDEPFTRLLTQGMVLKDGAKMSKSKGNTVDPNHLIAQYGADTVRLFVMFAAPPEHSLEWSDSGVEGAHRFLKRLWQFGIQHKNLAQIKAAKLTDSTTLKAQHAALRRQLHELLQQARYDYERQQFNTVVSGCMKMLNLLQDAATALPQTAAEELNELQTILQEGFSILLRLLAPITPHITHTLWQLWGMETIILNAKFPKPAADALKNDVLELVVQINGKLRGQINIDANADAAAIEAAALANETIQRHLDGKAIKKIIIVPKKLINIVA